jgi:hypothetical protein
MTPPVVTKLKSIESPVSPGISRSNSQRIFQVIPPHRVDLTLAPIVSDDLRVPSDINGRLHFSKPIAKPH